MKNIHTISLFGSAEPRFAPVHHFTHFPTSLLHRPIVKLKLRRLGLLSVTAKVKNKSGIKYAPIPASCRFLDQDWRVDVTFICAGIEEVGDSGDDRDHPFPEVLPEAEVHRPRWQPVTLCSETL